jgi:hypothetical protein
MAWNEGAGSITSYNWCATCCELWVAAWMRIMGVQTCPMCDAPVVDERDPGYGVPAPLRNAA